jgi:hypothetical protein
MLFQKWDKSQLFSIALAFLKSVANLCYSNDDLTSCHLLIRIQSPTELFTVQLSLVNF